MVVARIYQTFLLLELFSSQCKFNSAYLGLLHSYNRRLLSGNLAIIMDANILLDDDFIYVVRPGQAGNHTSTLHDVKNTT